jgi:hypothetical protein
LTGDVVGGVIGELASWVNDKFGGGGREVGEQRYLAALSPVDLTTACERLRARCGLAAFSANVEVEGDDWWEYAHADGRGVGFNLTRIGRCVNPAVWGWMWGAPGRANYQVIIHAASAAELQVAEQTVAEVLECEVARYPSSPGTQPDAEADSRPSIGN